MNKRLKDLRKKLDLTQTEFGVRLGVTGPAITKIEKGERNLTEQMILAICREFNVNESWLRTGEGGEESIFNNDSDSLLESLMQKNRLDDMSRKILKAFWDMPSKKREIISDFIYTLSRAVLDDDIDSVHKDIAHIVEDFKTNDSRAKVDLKTNINLAFNERFPYDDVDDVDIEALADENARIAREQTILEHKSKGKLPRSGSIKEA